MFVHEICLWAPQKVNAINQTFYCSASKSAHKKTCGRLLKILLPQHLIQLLSWCSANFTAVIAPVTITNINKRYRTISKPNKKKKNYVMPSSQMCMNKNLQNKQPTVITNLTSWLSSVSLALILCPLNWNSYTNHTDLLTLSTTLRIYPS